MGTRSYSLGRSWGTEVSAEKSEKGVTNVRSQTHLANMGP